MKDVLSRRLNGIEKRLHNLESRHSGNRNSDSNGLGVWVKAMASSRDEIAGIARQFLDDGDFRSAEILCESLSIVEEHFNSAYGETILNQKGN